METKHDKALYDDSQNKEKASRDRGLRFSAAPGSNNSLLFLVGGAIAIGAIIFLVFEERAKNMGITGHWPIPAYDSLIVARGILKDPIPVETRRFSWDIGQLVVNGNDIVGFSCLPGGDSFLSCLYSDEKAEAKLHDKTATIRYFLMPSWRYPAYIHYVRLSNGEVELKIPRKPAAIVMEVYVNDGVTQNKILDYKDSVIRLQNYFKNHPDL